MLNRDPTGLELRADPAALAPERLLVFEVRGSIGAFAAAVRNVPGLELIDEEELEADEADKAPAAYLMVPDVRALRDLESYGADAASLFGARRLGVTCSLCFETCGPGVPLIGSDLPNPTS